MSPKAGMFAGEVTPQAPADDAPTTKQKGYWWMEYGVTFSNCNEVWEIGVLSPDLHVGGQDTVTGIWNGDVITGIGVLKDARQDNIYVTNDTDNYTIYAGFNPGVEDGVAEVFFPECQWYDYSGPKLDGSMTHTNNLADATWNKTLTPIVTYDQIGIAGIPNTASRLTDDNTSGAEGVWKFGTANAVPSLSEEPVTAVFVIKKEASAPHYTRLLWSNKSSPLETVVVIFNAQTGTIILDTTGTPAPNPDFEVRSNGDWWEVYLQCDPNGVISNNGQVVIYPAWNTDGTAVPDITATGSITVGNVDFFAEQSTGVNGMTISNVRGAGVELRPSTVGSVIDQSRVFLDSSNHDDSEGGYYIEWRPLYSHSEIDYDIEILSLNDAAGLLYYDYSTQLLTATDGTNIATVSLTLVKETKYRLGVVWGSSQLRVGINTVWGTPVAYDGSFAGGSDLTICRNPLNVNYWRELRGFQVTYNAAFSEISTLMAG